MADYSVSVDMIGAAELKKAISDVAGVAQKALLDAVHKGGFKVEALAKEFVPHKSGTLQRSIHTDQPIVTANNIECHVGTDLEYARAQEYGTQGMSIHGRSPLGKQYTYMGNIPPTKYMSKARENVTPYFTQYMENAIKTIIRSLTTHG